MSQSIANVDTRAIRIPNEQIAWWVQLTVVLGALLTAAGAVIALIHPAMLVSPQDEINGAARIFAGYFAARNLGLTVALLALLAIRAKRALGYILALAGVIQLIDTAIDCVEGRWPIVPGVFILGLVFLFAAAKLCGHPLWKRQAWTE
ncbi:MAG TPA: hypothetical protein VMR02_02900 [Terracidiphilus sp.]|jgi:hypothetical protein|nr:hypothetical protein [Terracidiphilus sp.]